MDFAKAFSFVFEDRDWVQKIVIGGIVSLIPIVGQLLVFGYMIAIGRNVIRGDPQPLPDWSDFGRMIVDGLYVFVINLAYAVPIFIVLCLVLLPALAIGGAFRGDGDLGTVGVLGTCCFTAFAVIYGIFIQWFFLPAALGRYAETGDMMSALRFSEILDITRANPIVFLMALLVTWVAGFLAGLGVLACCIGVLFTSFYAQCVMGHAYGQAYLVAKGRVA